MSGFSILRKSLKSKKTLSKKNRNFFGIIKKRWLYILIWEMTLFQRFFNFAIKVSYALFVIIY